MRGGALAEAPAGGALLELGLLQLLELGPDERGQRLAVGPGVLLLDGGPLLLLEQAVRRDPGALGPAARLRLHGLRDGRKHAGDGGGGPGLAVQGGRLGAARAGGEAVEGPQAAPQARQPRHGRAAPPRRRGGERVGRNGGVSVAGGAQWRRGGRRGFSANGSPANGSSPPGQARAGPLSAWRNLARPGTRTDCLQRACSVKHCSAYCSSPF